MSAENILRVGHRRQHGRGRLGRGKMEFIDHLLLWEKKMAWGCLGHIGKCYVDIVWGGVMGVRLVI